MGQPTDFLSGLGGIQNLPNPTRDFAAGVATDEALRTTRLQREAAQLQLQQRQTQQRRAEDFQNDIATLGLDPTPGSIAGMIRKYPEFAEQLKSAHDIQDEAKRSSDFRTQAQVWSAAQAGRFDLAAKLLRSYQDASVAAGEAADPTDAALVEALESGDPDQQKFAMSLIGMSIAAINPKKFDETYNALNKGQEGFTLGTDQVRFDASGNVIARGPEKPPEYKAFDPTDDLYIQGGGASGLGSTSGTGADIEQRVATLVPGAVMTSGKRSPEKNAAVGGVPDSFHLSDRARDYIPPKGMSIAQLAENLREGLPRGYQVLPEDDHVHIEPASRGRAGDLTLVRRGAPKPGYRVLSREEVSRIPGLDAARAYQISPDGQITAIGGNDRGQLKPWPATQAASRSSNIAALRNIDGAIELFEPNFSLKDKSPKANEARRQAAIAHRAIGPGTGMLGDTYTQWNDPEGTDARARIGQIGGIIIKDTSGAAVSLAEDARLAKWVPLVTDTPKVALAKLKNLKRELATRNQTLEETFSEEQGYRPFSSAAPSGFRIVSVRPK